MIEEANNQMMTERYNQEKESMIQYNISELLLVDLSNNLKSQLIKLNDIEILKFLALFLIQDKSKIPEIKDSLNNLKEILPKEIFEDTKDEVKDICEDYKWVNSKDGKKILQIEEWIKEARHCVSIDFPSEFIYIGRSFINPISLIVGGYVKEPSIKKNGRIIL